MAFAKLSCLWKKSAMQTTLWSHFYERSYTSVWRYVYLRGSEHYPTREQNWIKATPVKGKDDIYSVVRHQCSVAKAGSFDKIWSDKWPLYETTRAGALKVIADYEKEWGGRGFELQPWRPLFWGKLASEVLAAEEEKAFNPAPARPAAEDADPAPKQALG
jgi:hypothetical protein